METFLMNGKERDRLAMFRRVEDKQLTLKQAAEVLSLSYRQAKRLWGSYRRHGDVGLVHGLRGRPSNNQATVDARRERGVGLYREHYRGFGPTLAAEQLAERHGLVVDHETLRGWLIGSGLWRVGRPRKLVHRRRDRRSCFGELVQLDGSDHHWFGPEQPRCVLMVMIDDATGRTEARFFEAETTESAMLIFRVWAMKFGLPGALYPDRHSIHRRNDKQADQIEHRTGKRPPTRFGAAMAELGVELIWAGSPQAKGRVERANATHQDRLVKLLALEGISDIDSANAYLEQTYLPRHNAKFAVEPAEAADVHRPVEFDELDAALCPTCEERAVDQTATVYWQGRRFELIGADATPRRRKRVRVRQRLDGTVQLVDIRDGRVLASRERHGRPKHSPTPPTPPPTLAQRVAARQGPPKPAANHPWRSAFVGADPSSTVPPRFRL
jgi:hypothetical protein